MESTSHQPQERPVLLTGRADVRRAVHGIILRVLRNSVARQQRRGLETSSSSPSDSPPPRPSEAQLRKALQRSRYYEDILYRRAASMEEHLDRSTLAERVFKVGRAVCVASRRREGRNNGGRRATGGGAVVWDGVERRGRRRMQSSQQARSHQQNDHNV